ncbi:MAG: acyl-CoA thioester hydrolase/BAAT C-terminal domain-containing protein [Planctomycetota bacterium]
MKTTGNSTTAILTAAMILLASTVALGQHNAEVQFQLPSEILLGERLSIRLSGMPPKAIVRIEAARITGKTPKLHHAAITVQADANGVVDLSKQAPMPSTDSSYSGIEPLGLLWSMKPTANADAAVEKPEQDLVTFTAGIEQQGSFVEAAKYEINLQSCLPDVEECAFGNQQDFEGTFLMMRPTDKPLPVIITLGGSEGGDMSARRTAPGLASRGFAVVGFPYYSPAYYPEEAQFPSLPQAFQEIPLERLEALVKLIDEHPQLDGSRIGLHGVSKGAEYVLASSSKLDRFQAVAAIVPSDVIWEGWGTNRKTSSFSYQGEALPFVPYKGMQEAIKQLQQGKPASIRIPQDAGRAANPDTVPAARIRVENIKAPLMIVGGDKDRTWDSGGMCRNIVATRKSAGLSTQAWISEDAGHYLSGHAYNPMPNQRANASLRTKTYPAMLEFFKGHLLAD